MKVIKKSGKPFKSGKKIEVVIKTTINSNTGLAAYSLEDGSIVDIKQCKEYKK